MTNNNRVINQIIEAMGINNKAEHVKIAWVHCLRNYDEKTYFASRKLSRAIMGKQNR